MTGRVEVATRSNDGVKPRPAMFESGLHNVFLFIALNLGGVALWNMTEFFLSEYNFVIVVRENVCEAPLNNRCIYYYKFEKKDHSFLRQPMSSHGFEDNDLKVGNKIKKRSFSFNYEVNGIPKNWHYMFFGVVLLVLSVVVLFIWKLPMTRRVFRKMSL